jgi:hypothetical protein
MEDVKQGGQQCDRAEDVEEDFHYLSIHEA